ncbi:MAG: peptide-methionine (R)-S-oxide reductase MsrB [Hyphomicrobiaceae bacterium]|nr:peptide-methionine (R)-S-oxide reductase MsrB [Hyphomicrobiaceae bacterium]
MTTTKPSLGASVAAKVQKSEAEWRQELSPEAFAVARQHGTERAFTSPLNDEKRSGMFNCVCCGEAVFASATKFDSGTGWPSFYAPASAASVETQEDRKFFMRRTEVHCARCDGHLGHVFPDGPDPTGLRYCINGAALAFNPEPTKD